MTKRHDGFMPPSSTDKERILYDRLGVIARPDPRVELLAQARRRSHS